MTTSSVITYMFRSRSLAFAYSRDHNAHATMKPFFCSPRLPLSSYPARQSFRSRSSFRPVNRIRYQSTFTTIPSCPAPTCQCAEMPAGLDIDREHDLNGSMATYKKQVLVFTGQSDWKSRVEEDGEGTAWGDFNRKLKGMTTRGGQYADVRPLHFLKSCIILETLLQLPDD